MEGEADTHLRRVRSDLVIWGRKQNLLGIIIKQVEEKVSGKSENRY